MHRISKVAVLVLGALASGGCATIVNGSNADLEVLSSPTGAQVYLDGDLVGMTPLTTKVEHRNHSVRVEKEGYVPAVAQITASFSGWAIIGIGLIVPILVDIGTGAVTSIDQKKVEVALQPVAPVVPAPPPSPPVPTAPPISVRATKSPTPVL